MSGDANEANEANEARDLVRRYGAEVTGSAVGDIAGDLIAAAVTGSAMGAFATPVGALAGAGLGVTAKLVIDFASRKLSSREKVRVGAVAGFALVKIKKRMDAGTNIRNDKFFSARVNQQSEAQEILEGVLLKAKNTHEERKAKFIGNIYANAVFRSDLTSDELNYTLQLVERLTYRQMVILSLFNRKSEVVVELRGEAYPDVVSSETRFTLDQIYQLYQQGFLKYAPPAITPEGVASGVETRVRTRVLPEADMKIAPRHFNVTELCRRSYEIMDLGEIPIEELEEVARCLSN